ncbi:cytochrome P450 4c3-like isoform X1 [Diaphorina citri]|uniref:Cytochrome P450 4c3-like isoform X1 n=1 Tax=Diaphorina citri TaxID=121845 RepID=A0A1S3DKH0_DIACI|nr:cytochrome P450 4c3-like isoform X2 [Diaphorina citri]XP_026686805.1 cytochrome P450 4c3-like isoform X1 [Diaphorina citri]
MSGCKARVRKNRAIQKEFIESVIASLKREILEEKRIFNAEHNERNLAPFVERVLRDRMDKQIAIMETQKSTNFNNGNTKLNSNNNNNNTNNSNNNNNKQDTQYSAMDIQNSTMDSKNSTTDPHNSTLDPQNAMDQRNSMSDRELLHEMVSLLNAGFETVMFMTSLTLILLAIHPSVQEEVYNELQDVLGDSPDSAPTYDQLQRLDLLTRVIKETMRLFPAAPVIARSAPYEVQCGDYTIPAGASIAIFIYGLHRHPQLWNNPNQFDPDRFLPSQSSHRNPSGYVPFSLGPRGCIGSKYAMLQMKTTISTILRRYKILPGDKCKSLQDIRFEFGMTMRSLPGNDIRIEPR